MLSKDALVIRHRNLEDNQAFLMLIHTYTSMVTETNTHKFSFRLAKKLIKNPSTYTLHER